MEEINECKECGNDSTIIYIVKNVYRGHQGKDLYVVECQDCGVFYPLKLDYFLKDKEFNEECLKKWNNENK